MDSGFGSTLGPTGSVSNLSSATSLTNIAGEAGTAGAQQIFQQQQLYTPTQQQAYQQVGMSILIAELVSTVMSMKNMLNIKQLRCKQCKHLGEGGLILFL